MSYILDALKKAERDRLREEADDIDDLSGSAWDPYTPAPPRRLVTRSMLSYGLIVLLLLAIGLAIGLYLEKRRVAAQLEALQMPSAGGRTQSELPAPARVNTASIAGAAAPAPLTATAPVASVPPRRSASEVRSAVLAAPDWVISGTIYRAEGSSSNRVFVGANAWREGDQVDANWIVHRIGIDVVELRAGERRVLLKYP